MVKTSLKTLFGNLLYIFVPMGVIYLFIIIASFAFVSSSLTRIGGVVSDAGEIMQSAISPDVNEIVGYFAGEIEKIDWNRDVGTIVAELLNTNWFADTLLGFIDYVSENYEAYAGEIEKIVLEAVDDVAGYLKAALGIVAIGMALSYFLCRIPVRRNSARRSIKKKLIAYLSETVLSAANIVLFLWLASLKPGPVAGALLCVTAFGFMTLLIAWLVQNDNRVPFKSVVNFKNIILLIAADLLIAVLTGAAVLLLFRLAGALIGLLIALPLLVYVAVVVSVNAESYVAEIGENEHCLRYVRRSQTTDTLDR